MVHVHITSRVSAGAAYVAVTLLERLDEIG